MHLNAVTRYQGGQHGAVVPHRLAEEGSLEVGFNCPAHGVKDSLDEVGGYCHLPQVSDAGAANLRALAFSFNNGFILVGRCRRFAEATVASSRRF